MCSAIRILKAVILVLLLTSTLSAIKNTTLDSITCKYKPTAKKYIYKYPYYAKDMKGVRKKYYINPSLIMAIIAQESKGNPHARSHAGARGLMQIIRKTAKLLGADYNKLFNPEYNIKYGVMFLAALLTEHKGDLVKTISSYNGGSWSSKNKSIKDKHFKGRIYNNPETKLYVLKVLKYYEYYKKHNSCKFK